MTTSNSQLNYAQEGNKNMSSKSEKEIQTWIVSYMSQLLDIPIQSIDIEKLFENYGLDSSAAISLIGDLESWLECDLSPTLLFDYPNIKTLSGCLAKEANASS